MGEDRINLGEGSECEDIRDRQALAGQALLKSTTRMNYI